MVNISRLIRSFQHALEGLWYAFSHDQNLRIHFIVGSLVIVASIVLDVSPYEMSILGLMILLVISAEMVNTSIEKMVDLITKEHRQEAKIAKDVAAGMVLITAFGSVLVAILIFLPHILHSR